MPACHAGGRGFEPLPGRHFFASVAQSVEQQTENLRVGGSIPPRGTIFLFYCPAKVAELADALDSGSSEQYVHGGSTPPFRTNTYFCLMSINYIQYVIFIFILPEFSCRKRF